VTTTNIPGASVWEQRMFDHLTSHGVVEGEILNTYKELAEGGETSAAFRYLAGIILEDEVRHHQMFADLAEAMRQTGQIRVEDEPIPHLAGLRKDKDLIMEVTERLLKVERDDKKELKALAKEYKPYRDTTLWGLLVELMRLDTEKHIMILKFMRDRSKDTY
jgi:hypothetical protein